MTQHPPRSVGRLAIGQPDLTDGIFSVDFMYSCTTPRIGEDEIQSVTLQVAKEFQKLLLQNGFWKPGQELMKPETAMKPIKDDVIHIICAVRIHRDRPIEIRTN
jgi:hypothetical protein